MPTRMCSPRQTSEGSIGICLGLGMVTPSTLPALLSLPADLHALTTSEYHHWLRTPEGRAANLGPGHVSTVLLPAPEEKELALVPPPYKPGGDSRGPNSGGLVQVGVRVVKGGPQGC